MAYGAGVSRMGGAHGLESSLEQRLAGVGRGRRDLVRAGAPLGVRGPTRWYPSVRERLSLCYMRRVVHALRWFCSVTERYGVTCL